MVSSQWSIVNGLPLTTDHSLVTVVTTMYGQPLQKRQTENISGH